MSSTNKPKVAFSQNLEAAIKAAGLSKKQFAELLGIKPQALTKYLNGRLPGGEILIKICRILGISADFLLGINQMTENSWRHRAIRAEKKLAAIEKALPLISKANSILSEIISG